MAKYSSTYCVTNNIVDERKNVVLEIVLRNGRVVFTGYEENGKYNYRGDGCFGCNESKTGLFIKAKYELQNYKSAKVRGLLAESL